MFTGNKEKSQYLIKKEAEFCIKNYDGKYTIERSEFGTDLHKLHFSITENELIILKRK